MAIARSDGKKPEQGNVFLTRNTDEVGNSNPGHWNHAAVMSWNGWVVEAQPEPEAVIAVPWIEFERRYPEILTIDLVDDGIRRGLIAWNAARLVGLPYATVPVFWRRGHNCVSVVRAAVKQGWRAPTWRIPDDIASAGKEVDHKTEYETWIHPGDWFAGMTKDPADIFKGAKTWHD